MVVLQASKVGQYQLMSERFIERARSFPREALGIVSLVLVKETTFLVPHREEKAARWLPAS